MEVIAEPQAVITEVLQELDLARATASARLRLLGQELEQREISDFEVVVEKDGYLVRGQVPPPSKTGRSKGKLGRLFRFKTPKAESDPHVTAGQWERRYSGSDLDQLEDEYRTRRAKTGMPDDYALSQVLRVVGAYVDARRWVLAGVNRTGQQIEISHRDVSGHLRRSHHTYAALYDFALRLHDARSATS